MDKFRRWPSELAKYFIFKQKTLQSYPSIEKFVLAEKLHWPDPPIAHSPQSPYTDPRTPLPKGVCLPWGRPGDYQIRLNDHPYAFAEGITHLVVWSAVQFAAGVSHAERMVVYEEFVERHFAEIPKDQRRWFLNWGSIQSVPGLEVESL